MSVAIFKHQFPITILYDFLQENDCEKDGEDYIITKEFYKRLSLTECLKPFLETITPFYYKSKQFYTTRDMTYNYFLTVIRQICNFHSIQIENKIHYSKSKHEITYRIINTT